MNEIEANTPLATQRGVIHALQLRALKVGVPLRAPPPEPTTCCGRGCNGCVWDGYFAATAFWEEDALQAIEDQRNTPS